MSMDNQLRYKISSTEAKELLAAEFVRDPLLLNEVAQLIADGHPVVEAAALFNYLFVATTQEAVGAVHPVVGFRFRDAEERLAALRACGREKAVSSF